MNMRQLCDSAGGRKFVLTVGCAAMTTTLVWFGKITSGDYAMIILGTVAVFIGGNTYESTKAKRNEPIGD